MIAEVAEPAPPATETIAGRYTVEEVLGRGGMARVYRVLDTRTGRKLALKRGWASDSKRAQKRRALLEREYHTLAQLAHPRIIEVYDYGVDSDGPYYTMELLDGQDLDRGGRVPWQQACALLRDVASSLAILHARGLIHRDISLRNVRCTADGRAKLIDFGAMTSMGVSKDVVGTPPFMAPEVLQMQALDARADLFSLGALGYHLLTGRHAFPARRLAELRDVWRSRPAAPQKLVPEIPAALSSLIMQLLTLDRSARPQNAAEVMERLCVIAGLPLEERVEVSYAYLSTPNLVGREKALLAVRRRMLSLVRGEGGTLLIEGAAGCGRSRMLDATAFEGKLLGGIVVRADAGDASYGDWGVARALGSQLFEVLPRETSEAARLSIDVLGHVIEGLRGDASISGFMPERGLLLRELRDFILALSRGQRLVIVVDDVERIDEPSLALLAALAHKTERHSLMLAVAAESDADQISPGLRVLRSVAERIELAALDADQTQALVCSLFGDVVNLHLCAGRIHAISQGNPRAIMELAQQLVVKGLARYAAGSWSLPAKLEEGDLPATLTASFATRLKRLTPDALEIAYLLCLGDGELITVRNYRELTSHADDRRVFRALAELVAARVLVTDGERYRVGHRGFMAGLEATLPAEERAQVHSRLADFLTNHGGDVMRRAHHLLYAGRDEEAVDLLCSIDLRARVPPLPLIELALARAERLRLPPLKLQALRLGVLSRAPLVLAIDSLRRCVPPTLALLERDSGLAAYRELPANMPEHERLSRALDITRARYLATPESERGYSMLEALRELGRITGSIYSVNGQSFDPDLVREWPDLAPLRPLSPGVELLEMIEQRTRIWLSGRRVQMSEMTRKILTRIGESDRGGLDETQHNRTRLALFYPLGLYEASMGSDAAEDCAHILEGDRDHRVSAWRVRLVMHINQGNAEEARKCLRRAELLQLQEGSDQRYLGTSSGIELIGYAHTGDLLGVKGALETVGYLAERCPGWQPLLSFGHCYHHWLRGDLEGALAALLPGFERGSLGQHPYATELAAAHVALLAELGRLDEAVRLGRRYAETCDREQLVPGDRFVKLALAQALARSGEHAEAVSLMERTIADGRKLGMTGLSIAFLYEGRARIAICMHDVAAFERHAELCAREYRKARNPALAQKLARLMEEAAQNRTAPSVPSAQIRSVLEMPQGELEHNTIDSQMLECADSAERARWALTLLLQSTDSCAGYLYGVWPKRVEPLAALPDIPPEDGLGRWVQARVEAELEVGGTATVSTEGEADVSPAVPARYVDQEGRCFEPILMLTCQAKMTIAGVLALQVGGGARSLPSRELLTEIADQLIKNGDVEGVAMPEVSATQEG